MMQIENAERVVSSASSAQVAVSGATAGYSLTSLPLSNIAAIISIVLSLVYLWGAMPRYLRTCAAFWRGVRYGDWSDWRKLGEKPMREKD